MRVGLEAVISFLPEKVVKREDFAYLDPVIPKGMEEMFRGADEFRRMEGEDAVEIMGVEVTKKVLDRAGLKPEDIDYIVSANLGGQYMIPMVGTHIHHEVGFPEEVPVLNIQTCCASFVDGFTATHIALYQLVDLAIRDAQPDEPVDTSGFGECPTSG